jgi:hypothetical protein
MHNDARRRKRMKVAARCLGCACQRFVYPAATVGGEDLMDRGHEFIVDLPGEGTYIVKLLEGVRIEQSGGSAVYRNTPDFRVRDQAPLRHVAADWERPANDKCHAASTSQAAAER